MERIIFKYSDFIQDDGAFEKALKNVEEFGDKIVASAKKTQSDFKKALDLNNTESIANYEKESERLNNSFKKQQKAKEDLKKIEQELINQRKKTVQGTEEQLKNLADLDKQLLDHRANLKDINKQLKDNTETDRDLNKERVQAQIEIKKVSKEIRDQQKEIISANELTAKEIKLAEARNVLQRDEVRNREELRERIKALRIVVDSLDFEEQADEIAKYNLEIDSLTEKLGDNSDKFIQSKINIGNYEESILNALKSSNLFQGELSFLNDIIDKGVDFFTRSKEANEDDIKAKEQNTKATSGLRKGISTLNKVAKATVILALVSAISSLASVFGQGRSGAIATARATAVLQTSLRALIDVGQEVGKGLFTIFSSIGTSFTNLFSSIELFALNTEKRFLEMTNAFGRNSEAINKVKKEIEEIEQEISDGDETNYAEGWNQISDAIGSAGQKIEDARKSINTLDEASIKAFQIADDIKRSELAIIDLRKEVQLLEIRSGDSTISLLEQLRATDELLDKRVELLRRESDVSRQNLSLANAKARADAERLGFNLAQDEVKFAEELLALNIRLSEERGENNLNDEFLNESIEALKTYKETLTEIEIAEKETAQTRREIQRDIFEQNLDLLIDLIDTEKNLSEQFVNDTTRNFETRINEFNGFLIKFRQNTQLQLEEFNKQANSLGLDLDFEINYDEDGNFEVFIGDTKLATDNIVLLNEQLQNTGLGEIEINRFREFLIETNNGVRDFRDLNKELGQVGIEVRKLREDLSVSDDELNALKNLDERIFELRKRSSGTISTSDRKRIVKQIEELEQEKSDIIEFAEFQRLNNQIQAIDDELKVVEEGSERYYELLQERNEIEKEILDKSSQDQIDAEKEKNKKILEDRKRVAEETRAIIGSVLDAVIESQSETVARAQESSELQQEAVNTQYERAQQGLENTLAFEQRELGRREAERIKEEEKQQRLEKIKALYSSYSNYAGQGDGDNAIVKALRDFAILESIQATFGDGGIVEDKIGKVPTNGKGIIRGRSHQGRNGGIPVLVERNEGFLSGREMENLGKENFYKMKEIASLGKVDSNFFSKQRQSFVTGTTVVVQDNKTLINEMKNVQRAIQNKPESQFEIEKFADATFNLIKTVKTKNRTQRSTFKIRKDRF